MATAVSFDDARRVADAVLFEGYLLYPYRASATKNQLRWQFGIVAPPGADTGDASMQQAAVLADGLTDDARIDLCVRFLHLETRRDAVPWDEGRVVEHTYSSTLGELLTADGVTTCVREPPGVRTVDDVSYERAALAADVHLGAERLPGPYGAVRVVVRITNTGATPPTSAPRATVMRTSLVGTHSLLATDHGRFVSPADPPEWARPAVDACEQVGCFPVLVGEADDVVLCSPIILADHPEIAPESPGPSPMRCRCSVRQRMSRSWKSSRSKPIDRRRCPGSRMSRHGFRDTG